MIPLHTPATLLAVALLSWTVLQPWPAGAAEEPWSSPEAARAAIEDCLAAHSEDETACRGAVVDACLEVPEQQTTFGMIDCAGAAHAGWDALLNEAYGVAMKRLDPRGKELLRDAQRKWIAYRDARCAVWPQIFEGGSMGRVLAADCLRDETANRAFELRAIAAQLAL